jgi:hypothetical protein
MAEIYGNKSDAFLKPSSFNGGEKFTHKEIGIEVAQLDQLLITFDIN